MVPIDNYKPKIGKNVIETLTLGMYENSFFIYREYVQNAADQIDIAVEENILDSKSDGKIEIIIDKENKKISIEDNATGIKSKDVLKFLGDVADSQKDRTKRKGFRGIGRLGGLGYCNKLIFETSFYGEEVKNTILLDAKLLRDIIEDKADTSDAATVISIITTLDKKQENKDAHYFKVTLEDVTKEELLDIGEVEKYLSMVAPVPFNNEFEFSNKIYSYFKNQNFHIDEYDILLSVNNKKLYKAYKNKFFDKTCKEISELIDVDFFKIENNEKETIAIGWYGVGDLLNKILHRNNFERGIRLRKENIQIGDENTLNKFFKEDRFNHHFVGEIHIIGDSFVPNARRDYFNDNKTVQQFEKKLKTIFDNLYKLARDISRLHNRYKEILLYKEFKEEYENKEFRSQNEKNHYEQQFKEAKNKAIKAISVLANIADKKKNNNALKILFKRIIDIELLSNLDFEQTTFAKDQIQGPKFSKLNNDQIIIVNEIFEILNSNLNIEDAEKIKQLIIDKYN